MVIGVGTRWSDFTTASRTAFAADGVRFVNVNVAAFDTAKHAGSRGGGRRPGRAAGAARRAGRLAVRPGLPGASRGSAAELGRDRLSRLRPRPPPAAGAVRGDRRGQRRHRPAGRGDLRGRLDAGRPAQAVADPRPQGLPRRVRVLLHGLRDRRRPRRGDGVRDPETDRRRSSGRRRVVPDDGAGAGDRRAGGRQPRSWCWCRTTASPRSASCPRVARVAAVRHPRTGTATPAAAGWTATCCRSTSPPTPRASASGCCGRSGSTSFRASPGEGPRVTPDDPCCARRDRPAGAGAGQRVLVGRAGRRGVAAGVDAPGRRARRTRPRRRTSARTWIREGGIGMRTIEHWIGGRRHRGRRHPPRAGLEPGHRRSSRRRSRWPGRATSTRRCGVADGGVRGLVADLADPAGPRCCSRSASWSTRDVERAGR